MAYISFQPKDYFNTKLYTGNGSDQVITGVGFQPDWVWLKGRSFADNHVVVDAVRGTNEYLHPDTAQQEYTSSSPNESVKAFGSDGFTLGGWSAINRNTESHVSWNWRASNATAVSNTDGSITSTVSANTTSGFSIVKYVGTGSNATIGHGLNTAPTALFVKNLDAAEQWINYDVSNGATKYYHLNLTDAAAVGSTIWNNTAPTTSVFSVGTVANVNSSGANYVAYCFSNIAGFSKIGSYTGNGNADGPMIYTGFKPAFVIIKRTDTANNWLIFDNKRDGFNPQNDDLQANSSNAENASNRIDILSNGFKIRVTDIVVNASGGSYIYMAFSDQSIVSSNGVPAVAR